MNKETQYIRKKPITMFQGVGKGLCDWGDTSHVEARLHSLTYTRQHVPVGIEMRQIGDLSSQERNRVLSI